MVFNCPSEGDSGSEAGVTTKQILCGILPIPTFPNQGKEYSVGFLLIWEGGLQDTLPNSGRARVGSDYYFVIPVGFSVGR